MEQYLFRMPVDEGLNLVAPTTTEKLAAEIFNLVDGDREHLGRYLPWVEKTTSVQDELNFLKMMAQQQIEGKTYLFVIEFENQIVGTIDLHFINPTNGRAEIGYWLSSAYTGKGIMTRCVKKVAAFGFQILELNRIDIYCDVENVASTEVAKRAGFDFLATQPDADRYHDDFHDMHQYVLLRRNFMEG